MPRPLIGIVGEIQVADRSFALPLRYAEAVERAGGLPFGVSPIDDAAYRNDLLDATDGLVFSGGDDFDMRLLGRGATHPAAKPVPREKQRFDFALAEDALARRVPVLGICYGMQCLGLVGGAELHQHLPEDRPGSRAHSGGVVHAVDVRAGTKLFELVGAAALDVVSRHHQALASVGPGWRVGAVDDEGLIEAIERADHPFALGVQWHPELSPESPAHAALFRGLVDAARARGRARRAPEPVA